jgi:hypothetical protein
MKRKTGFVIAMAALVSMGSISAFGADLPSPVSKMPAGVAKQNLANELEDMGYENVTVVESNGRYYTAHAQYDGVWYPLEIDMATGHVQSFDDVPTMSRSGDVSIHTKN